MLAGGQEGHHPLLGPVDELDDPVGHPVVCGPSGQQMGRPDCLGGFGEHGGAALGDELVDGHAQGRIGGQPAGGVRPAALQGQHQAVGRDLCRLALGSLADHLLDNRPSLGNGFRHAHVLNHQPLERLPGACLGDLLGHLFRIAVLTAQAQHQGAGHVGMRAEGRHHPLRSGHVLPAGASAGVGKGHGAFHRVGYLSRDLVGTQHGGEHHHVVAHAESPVRPLVAVDSHSVPPCTPLWTL